MVDDVARGELLRDVVERDAGLDHQDHDVIGEVGDLVDGLLFVLGLGGDDDLGALLTHLFEDLVEALVEQIAGIGPLGHIALAALEQIIESLK